MGNRIGFAKLLTSNQKLSIQNEKNYEFNSKQIPLQVMENVGLNPHDVYGLGTRFFGS